MFSCEVCEIFNSIYFEKHLLTTASKKIVIEGISYLVKQLSSCSCTSQSCMVDRGGCSCCNDLLIEKSYAISNSFIKKQIHTAATTYTTQFYESYIPNNQTYKHNPNSQNNHISAGFTTNTEFMLLQLRQCNSGVFIFKLRNKLANFVNFIHHQFAQFIDPEEPVRSFMNNFVHFIHPYMNPLPLDEEVESKLEQYS